MQPCLVVRQAGVGCAVLDENPLCSHFTALPLLLLLLCLISRAVWYAAAGQHDSNGQRTPKWGHDASARTPRDNDGRPAGAPRHAGGARLWCAAGGIKHAADVSGRTTCECQCACMDTHMQLTAVRLSSSSPRCVGGCCGASRPAEVCPWQEEQQLRDPEAPALAQTPLHITLRDGCCPQRQLSSSGLVCVPAGRDVRPSTTSSRLEWSGVRWA